MYQFGGPITGWPQLPSISYDQACGSGKHLYSLCFFGGKRKINESYSSRYQAQERMYAICKKFGLSISKVWDDKHYKTYFTTNGGEFHINRMF